MIGIGIDIEDISRFSKYNMKNDMCFLKTIYTDNELQYCYANKFFARHLATRFCAKEAFYKATSKLNIEFQFNEIEILNKTNGEPYLNLPDKFKTIQAFISISHDVNKAIAMIVIDKRTINE